MKVDTKMLLLCLACVIAGWWMAGESSSQIERERPVLRWIGKTARTLLWVSLFAEPAPADDSAKLVHARVDADGVPVLDHARGW